MSDVLLYGHNSTIEHDIALLLDRVYTLMHQMKCTVPDFLHDFFILHTVKTKQMVSRPTAAARDKYRIKCELSDTDLWLVVSLGGRLPVL